MMQAGFTVLLSTYNGERYLKEQLDSILTQSLPPKTVLVRDDGSTDGTLAILRTYGDKITVIEGENLGFLGSFHALLELAPDDGYFAFSDQDDIWLENKLELASKYLTQGDDAVPRLYHGAYAMVTEELAHLSDFLPKTPAFDFRRCLTENVCSGFALCGNAALRRAMLRYDWTKLDYHDWLAAAVALGLGEAMFDDTVTALHRRLSTSITVDTKKKGWVWAIGALRQDTNMKRRNVAFYRCFEAELPPKQRALSALFARFDLAARLKKAFYPKRWRYGLPDEVAVRLAMLFGTL